MYKFEDIQKFIFVDIETVSEYPTLTDLEKVDRLMGDLWRKRCVYLRRRYQENAELSDDRLYAEKAALHAEFSKIVCISIGIHKSDGAGATQVRAFASHDEKEILEQFLNFMDKYFKAYQQGGKLVGHNIKRFDVPFLLKRAYKHKIEIPYPLIDVAILKPWESPIIDTSEMWGFGAWQETFTSLELLTHHLDIPSPKEVMHADEVGTYYWESKDLDTIAKYCNHDVLATMNVLLEMCGYDKVNSDNVQFI